MVLEKRLENDASDTFQDFQAPVDVYDRNIYLVTLDVADVFTVHADLNGMVIKQIIL